MKSKTNIEIAVDSFFGLRRCVYATPGTDNHSANYYGDHRICKLTPPDVIFCIENARDSWTWDDDQEPELGAIDAVLADLQFDKPKGENQ